MMKKWSKIDRKAVEGKERKIKGGITVNKVNQKIIQELIKKVEAKKKKKRRRSQ